MSEFSSSLCSTGTPKISHISVSVWSTWKLSNSPLPCRYPFRFTKWDLTSIELLHLGSELAFCGWIGRMNAQWHNCNIWTVTRRHVYKFKQMTLWSHFLWRSLPSPPFMFATFALLLFLLLFTPVFVNTNRYVLVMARETLQTQIIHNLCDYIARSTTSRKGVDDENKHLTTYDLRAWYCDWWGKYRLAITI